MALGKSIHKFAADLFPVMWESEELDVSKISKSELCATEPEVGQTPEIKYALKLRTVLFKVKLTRDLRADYSLYERNLPDFKLYLVEHMIKYFPYPCMRIFNKLLMSCVVVTTMAGICHEHKNNIYQHVGPESWAMYFKQEHGNEFSEAGGWKKLQEYAEKLYEFKEDSLQTMNGLDDDLKKVKMGWEIITGTCYTMDILGLFEKRTEFNDDKQCCSSCFPLFDVLNSLTRRSAIKVGDFQLVEGYLQLFHRVDMKRRLILEKEIEKTKDVESEVDVDAKCQRAYTDILQNNLFPSLNENGTWKPLVDECCRLCGEDKKAKSVPYIKSIFRRTAFEIEDEEIKEKAEFVSFLK